MTDLMGEIDPRLHTVKIDDCELSIRCIKALKDCGCKTLADAQKAIQDRSLHKVYGIGRRAVSEVKEIIVNVLAILPKEIPMTDKQTPPDWVLIEAAKRSEYANAADPTWMRKEYPRLSPPFRALCDMILKHEPAPADRKLLCAREALMQCGWIPNPAREETCIRAIELWEEGFGA